MPVERQNELKVKRSWNAWPRPNPIKRNMDEKEKAAQEAAAKAQADADAKAAAEAEAKAKAEDEANVAVRALAEKDEKISKLTDERDNYKKVALKRLGKLPGDEGFVEGVDKDTGLTFEETVKKVLLDQEIAREEAGKDTLIKSQAKQISELTLALKNRPGSALGGGSGDGLEVKDNVFSEQQILNLRKRAERLKVDPEEFIERAKNNILSKR